MRVGVAGLELSDAFEPVLEIYAAVLGVDVWIGDALGRGLVRAFGMHATPHAAVELQQAPGASVAVIGIRLGIEPGLAAHESGDEISAQSTGLGGPFDPGLGLFGHLDDAGLAGGLSAHGHGRDKPHQQTDHEHDDRADDQQRQTGGRRRPWP